MEIEKGTAASSETAFRSLARTAETVLRVLPLGLCVAALVVMRGTSVDSDTYGRVTYAELSGFQYLVYANAVCAAYSLASAFYTASPKAGDTLGRAWSLYLLDQVFTYVVLAAAAASAEVLYLAYVGEKDPTWSEACGELGGFCRRAGASVGVTFAAVACYVGISLLSAYRLFSSYDAAIPFLGKGPGVAAFPGEEN